MDISPLLSSMNGAKSGMLAAANNIANAQTPDYKPIEFDGDSFRLREPQSGSSVPNADMALEIASLMKSKLQFHSDAAALGLMLKTDGKLLELLSR